MSADNSQSTPMIPEQSGRGPDNAPRTRRTKAEIEAARAEANRPPRQSGRPIDRREVRGSIDMDAIKGLLGGETPNDNSGDGERPSRRPNDSAARGSEHSDNPDRTGEDQDQDRAALELDEDDEDAPKRKTRPKTLADFAKENELDAAKLYDLHVAYDDGESVSLKDLKDHYRESGDLQRSRDDFEDYRTEAQNEVLLARQQIDGVLRRLTEVVPAEHLARAFTDYQADAAERARADKQRLREWFPEWDDAQTKAADKAKLTETLKSYGFSSFEVDTIQDARIIRFGIHAMRLMDRYKRLKANFEREKVPSKAPPSRQPARRPDRSETAKRQAEGGDVVGAVATLIG